MNGLAISFLLTAVCGIQSPMSQESNATFRVDEWGRRHFEVQYHNTPSLTIIDGDVEDTAVSIQTMWVDPIARYFRQGGLSFRDTVSSVTGIFSAGRRSWSNLHPLDRNYPDFAEVPEVAHFVEFNTSWIVLALAGVVVAIVVNLLFWRHHGSRLADSLADLPVEKILQRESYVLGYFIRRNPDHPAAGAAAMVVARRKFDAMNFEASADFYESAIRLGGSAKNPEAHFHLAACLRQLGYLCDAIDEWMAAYLDDPDGQWGRESLREAQRWRAYQVVRDKRPCPACAADTRLSDLRCPRCDVDLNRTVIPCGICGKSMIKEAQVCIHCLPDDIKVEVARGVDWPIVKTTTLDWEAQMIKSRFDMDGIPCALTGEKGSAIPLTVGYLGEIHIRVPLTHLSAARDLLLRKDPKGAGY